MAKVYKGEVGIPVTVATGITLTGATSTTLSVQKPDGTTATWTASIDGADAQQLNYTIATGDIDLAGDYLIQAHVTLGTQTLIGETYRLIVYDLFK